ncbi:MAG: radical SAM protein [Deltaproteobacteria bacterium]|nr:radical SAM protein [Deltaproteobacteria bacterium]
MTTKFDLFTPCCADWFSEAYHFLEVGDDPWNGTQAQELRRRILQGDYRLCNRQTCNVPLATLEELKASPAYIAEAVLSREVLAAMEAGQVELPGGPSVISVTADPRCNLKCPSCRADHIHTVTPDEEKGLEKTEAFLRNHRESVRLLKFGNGEVFFSPWLRRMLKGLSSEVYPHLEAVSILSNGLLADEHNFKLLEPGSKYIKRVNISVDAGNAPTYRKTRGGDWERLLKNLGWLAQQRRAGRFEWLALYFVTRKDNFESIPEFIELGRELGVDMAYFSAFFDRGSMSDGEYREQTVHLPLHPLHGRLAEICGPYRTDQKLLFRFPL